MNEPRYIDANSIKLTAQTAHDCDGEIMVPLRDVVRAIALAPTVDIPPRYAFWSEKLIVDIFSPERETMAFSCSNCGCLSRNNSAYCPDCGRIMLQDRAGLDKS